MNIANPSGKPLLHLARDIDVVRCLVEYGADVNAVDRLGETALFGAVQPDIVQFLIDHGAEVDSTPSSGSWLS